MIDRPGTGIPLTGTPPASARTKRRSPDGIRVATLLLALAAMAAGAEPTAWDFRPGADDHRADAMLDLRTLNEPLAGQAGFVRRSADGASFARGDGTPLRFWGVLLRTDTHDWTDEQIDRHYRMMAKRGVNLVRLFGQISVHTEGATIDQVDEVQIARFHRHVAAARRAGIYAMIAPFWNHAPMPGSWGMEGSSAYGLLFASARFRAAYLGWMRELLTRPNPHRDGVPLKDEPAVAVLQIHNEDSLLWHSAKRIPEPYQEELRLAFGAWLAKRHGSIAAAITAWDGVTLAKDDPAGGIAELYIAWQLCQPAAGGMAKRLADQIEFLAGFQRGIYADIVGVLRRDLGCRHLINACNWHTVDAALVGDTERWTYTAGDLIAVNRYTGGHHGGKDSGWKVDAGHELGHCSVLRRPETLALGVRQPVGHPFMLTESAWVFPNRYAAEGPFATAVFGSLSGLDGTVWSMVSAPEWQVEVARPWTRKQPHASLNKWMIDTPACLGGFPAHALAYRRGDIATPSRPAVHQTRRPEDMWARVPSTLVEGKAFDPNVKDSVRDDGAHRSAIDVRAFLVGPVTVSFDGKATADAQSELATRITGDHVTSLGDEVATDTRLGVCRVGAPRFQGVCGFLREAGGSFPLRDVTITCTNEYAAVSVVALDDAPLAGSRSVLVQIGTEAWPTGWRTEPADKPGIERVVATGDGPWRVTAGQGEVSIRNPHLRRAVALDVNGYASREAATRRDGDRLVVTLPPDALYVVLDGKPAAP